MDDGLEPEVIVYAIEQAALAGSRTSSYINGILLNLHSEGITTRDQAEARERDRMQQKRWGVKSDETKLGSPKGSRPHQKRTGTGASLESIVISGAGDGAVEPG